MLYSRMAYSEQLTQYIYHNTVYLHECGEMFIGYCHDCLLVSQRCRPLARPSRFGGSYVRLGRPVTLLSIRLIRYLGLTFPVTLLSIRLIRYLGLTFPVTLCVIKLGKLCWTKPNQAEPAQTKIRPFQELALTCITVKKRVKSLRDFQMICDLHSVTECFHSCT